jgi:uncharacterized protein (DUF2461 family)
VSTCRARSGWRASAPASPTFGELWGEQRLRRPPRGYSEDTPLIELIKLKSFIVVRERDVTSGADDALDWLAATFRAMDPFLRWLRRALEFRDPYSLLDPAEERALAEEGLEADLKSWPEY